LQHYTNINSKLYADLFEVGGDNLLAVYAKLKYGKNGAIKIYKEQNQRYIIMTSAPSLINALKKSNNWNCIRYGRVSEVKKGVLEGTTSKNRITASFELK